MKRYLAILLSVLLAPTLYAQTPLTAPGLASFSQDTSGGGGGDTQWLSASGLGTLRNNFGGVVGNTFTVNSSITITSLGSYVVSGSTQTHRIAIWNASLTKLAEVSLNKNGLAAGFQFVSLGASSITLSSGTYYIGEEEFSGGDSWYNDDQVTVTTTGVATITTSSFHSGTYDAPNSAGTSGVKSFGPPNFLYH